MPHGAKPIAMNANLILYTFQGYVGLMSTKCQILCEPLAVAFKPKNMVCLDCSKTDGYNLMLVGAKSSNDFAVINFSNNQIKPLLNGGMPNSLKKVFSKNQDFSSKNIQFKHIEVLDQEDSQKLVIMCCYNVGADQYTFYTLVLRQSPGPKWDFQLLDTYRMKPGKLVHNFTLSHYLEDKNMAKIIISYDCSKMVEVMVNIVPNAEKFDRVVTKLKHSLNFTEIANMVKIEGSTEMIVQDKFNG